MSHPVAAVLPVRGQEPAFEVSIESIGAAGDLEARWRALEARADAPFFLSWHWIGTWLAVIGETPALLAARRGGVEVGLGLLLQHPVRRYRVLERRALFLNQTGDPDRDIITIEYNDILAARDVADQVRAACLRHLFRTRRVAGRRWDELHLKGVAEAVAATLPARTGTRELAVYPSARVDLRAIGRTGDFLDHVSANTRRQIRRAIALYRERGPLQLTAAASVDEALAIFAEAGALHQARWTARGRPGAFAYPFFVAFHQALIRRCFDHGCLELARITAGDAVIGCLYNFLYRGTVSYYFSGFAYEEDNRLKPGLVSHCLCIDRHLRAGADCYDFMGGANRYKYSLGRPGPTIRTVLLPRPGPVAWAETGLRRIKAGVADPLLAALRRRRSGG